VTFVVVLGKYWTSFISRLWFAYQKTFCKLPTSSGRFRCAYGLNKNCFTRRLEILVSKIWNLNEFEKYNSSSGVQTERRSDEENLTVWSNLAFVLKWISLTIVVVGQCTIYPLAACFSRLNSCAENCNIAYQMRVFTAIGVYHWHCYITALLIVPLGVRTTALYRKCIIFIYDFNHYDNKFGRSLATDKLLIPFVGI